MSDTPVWTPPAKIEDLFAGAGGSKFAAINSPVAGARTEKPLESGSAPIQLHSLATPNGIKVGILLEELEADYDAHVVRIMDGDQFTSGFVELNPNSKIPALLDNEGPDGKPIHLFESASICLYLAEKFQRFLPTTARGKAEMQNWVMWQMGGLGPMTGQFGHFFVYAPADKCEARDYGCSRYGMEVQRLCSVLDQHLANHEYMVEETYTVCDMIVYPWIRQLLTGYPHPSGIAAKDFLSMEKYTNIINWANKIGERPAVQRGVQVCSIDGGKPWLNEKK